MEPRFSSQPRKERINREIEERKATKNRKENDFVLKSPFPFKAGDIIARKFSKSFGQSFLILEPAKPLISNKNFWDRKTKKFFIKETFIWKIKVMALSKKYVTRPGKLKSTKKRILKIEYEKLKHFVSITENENEEVK